MGAICPQCNKFVPIVQILTADGTAPRKGEDGVIQVLGCGHTYGKEEFTAYQRLVAQIQGEHNKASRDLKDKRDELIRGAWEAMKVKVSKERGK